MRPIVYLAAPAIAALIGLGARAAYAACITPAGKQVTAISTLTIKLNNPSQPTVTCDTTVTFTPPDPSCTPPDPLCINADSVSFSNCTGVIGTATFFPSVSAANGGTGWQICLSGNGMTSQLKIPPGGLVSTVMTGAARCTTTIPPSTFTSTQTVSGTWNNANSSMAFTNQSVPVTTTGGFPCPVATTGTISGTFTTRPAITIN